jgi:hypothetical protein
MAAPELEVVVRGLDLATMEPNPELVELRGVLERNTTPDEAGSVLEALARYIVAEATTPELERFRADLAEINRLEAQIWELYDAAVPQGPPRLGARPRPVPGLAERLSPLQERQAELFDRLSRYPDVDRIVSGDLDLAARLEEQGRSLADLPREDPTEIRAEPGGAPARPRASPARSAAIDAALLELTGVQTSIRMRAARPTRSYARQQFLLLRDLDPIAASQGYEVRVTGNGLDIHLDGVEPLGGGGFRVLEAKYNDPALESIYSESRGGGGSPEGSLRDEISRLTYARAQLAAVGCQGIHIVTNTASSRASILAVLDSMGITPEAAGITIEVRPL